MWNFIDSLLLKFNVYEGDATCYIDWKLQATMMNSGYLHLLYIVETELKSC